MPSRLTGAPFEASSARMLSPAASCPPEAVPSVALRAAMIAALAAAVLAVQAHSAAPASVALAYVPVLLLTMWLPGSVAPAAAGVLFASLAGAGQALRGLPEASGTAVAETFLPPLVLLVTGLLCRCRKKDHLELADSRALGHLFAALARGVATPLTVVDASHRVVFWNEPAALRYGLTPEREGEAELIDLFAPSEAGSVLSAVARAQRGETQILQAVRKTREDGLLPLASRLVPLRGPSGAVLAVAIMDEAAPDGETADELVDSVASRDLLTGLPNRKQLYRVLEAAFAGREHSEGLKALLFIDLDGFKGVNDALGHGTGDEVLRGVTQRLVSLHSMLPGAHPDASAGGIFRWGGDEFVALLDGLDGVNDAADFAHLVVCGLQRPVEVGGHAVHISASIGIAVHPWDATDTETLVRHADIAMYRAKERGPGQCVFFSPEMNDSVQRRFAIATCLSGPLDPDSYGLVYQPLWCLKTRRIVGVEALLRFHDATIGTVSPDELIPIAEDTGRISALGRWVLQTAYGQARAWAASLPTPLRVAVNVSSRQLGADDLAEAVLGLDGGHALERPELLELEITEGAAVEPGVDAVGTLQRLRDAGVRIVIDDFGAGFSSLSRVRMLPVHGIKIDREFVAGIPHSARDRAFVVAILQMTRILGLSSVAEGVECADQLEFLEHHDCDYGQGFFLGRPVPAEEIAKQVLLGERGVSDPAA